MKQKTFNKKLVINKFTISNLTDMEKAVILGGSNARRGACGGTVQGRTCDQRTIAVAEGAVQRQAYDGTVQGRTCDEPPD